MAFTASVNGQYATSDASGAQVYRSVSAEQEDRMNVELPAAKEGVLTTRTSDTAGVVTETAHVYGVGNKVDIFWATGSRLGVNVDAVAANTYTFSGGTGDNLPAAASAVWTFKPEEAVRAVVRAKTVAIIVSADGPYVLRTNSVSAPDDVWEFPAQDGFVWTDNGVFAHPFTADVTSFWLSNGRTRSTRVELRHLRNE